MLKFEFTCDELRLLNQALVELSYEDKKVLAKAESPELRDILKKELGLIGYLSHKILFEGEAV